MKLSMQSKFWLPYPETLSVLLYFRCAGGRTERIIDPEKFLYSVETKRVELENFRRACKLGVNRQQIIYRNLRYTDSKMLHVYSILHALYQQPPRLTVMHLPVILRPKQ